VAKSVYFIAGSIGITVKSIDFTAKKAVKRPVKAEKTQYKFLILRSLRKMAQFPKAEADVSALTMSMMSGYSTHAADFPSADPAALGAAFSPYMVAKNAQTDAMAAAQVATEAKNTALDALEEVMRAELKKSEVDVGSDGDKLEYIGWGPKSAPSPSTPPGQPRNLESVIQGAGTLFLDWKAPARGTGGTVRTYIIERREQPAGGGEFGVWSQVGIAMESETSLTNQPRGPQLEYRVKAVNVGGESIPSNTVAIVL